MTPAPRSMNVVWFAVDRDGGVAVFQSEDMGPVPRFAACDADLGLTVAIMSARPVSWN